jgi:hypothetical protein
LVRTLQAIEPRFLGCPACSTVTVLSYPCSPVQPTAVTVLTELPTAHSQSPRPERPASSPNCQINCPSVFYITFSFFHISSPPHTASNQYTVALAPPYSHVRHFCTSLQVVQILPTSSLVLSVTALRMLGRKSAGAVTG